LEASFALAFERAFCIFTTSIRIAIVSAVIALVDVAAFFFVVHFETVHASAFKVGVVEIDAIRRLVAICFFGRAFASWLAFRDAIAGIAGQTSARIWSDWIRASGELRARVCFAFVHVDAEIAVVAAVGEAFLAIALEWAVSVGTDGLPRACKLISALVDVYACEAVAAVAIFTIALVVAGWIDTVSVAGTFMISCNTFIDISAFDSISGESFRTGADKRAGCIFTSCVSSARMSSALVNIDTLAARGRESFCATAREASEEICADFVVSANKRHGALVDVLAIIESVAGQASCAAAFVRSKSVDARGVGVTSVGVVALVDIAAGAVDHLEARIARAFVWSFSISATCEKSANFVLGAFVDVFAVGASKTSKALASKRAFVVHAFFIFGTAVLNIRRALVDVIALRTIAIVAIATLALDTAVILDTAVGVGITAVISRQAQVLQLAAASEVFESFDAITLVRAFDIAANAVSAADVIDLAFIDIHARVLILFESRRAETLEWSDLVDAVRFVAALRVLALVDIFAISVELLKAGNTSAREASRSISANAIRSAKQFRLGTLVDVFANARVVSDESTCAEAVVAAERIGADFILSAERGLLHIHSRRRRSHRRRRCRRSLPCNRTGMSRQCWYKWPVQSMLARQRIRWRLRMWNRRQYSHLHNRTCSRRMNWYS
jgi:hypothetical protein